jgi:diguanylate cyclase (GGDEF)-like protein
MRYLASLVTAVLVLIVTIGVGLYVDRKHEAMHTRNASVTVGLERMVRLNQAMDSILRAAVHEQNGLRASGYDTLQQELEVTMKSVVKDSLDLPLASEIAALAGDHLTLRQVESRALAHIQRAQWQEARAVLFDERFVLSRKIYEINSETTVGALTGELAAMTAGLDEMKQGVLAALVCVMLLLIGIGAAFTRRIQLEQRQQARLQSEITRANDELEAKVRQRTAELEIANDKLQMLSTTDALTGLFNRRHFDAQWHAEWQRALRAGNSVAMIMLDVDHFKAFNDSLGHPAGDSCLQRVGGILGAVRDRAGDLAARYGGEEFAMILPACDASLAGVKAEGLRKAILAAAIAHPQSPTAPVVTVSAGVASCIPRMGQDPADLLLLADQALYQAKLQGRNRVMLAA